MKRGMDTSDWIYATLSRARMRVELDSIKGHVEQWCEELREKGCDTEETYVIVDQTIERAYESGRWSATYRALASVYLDRWYDNAE